MNSNLLQFEDDEDDSGKKKVKLIQSSTVRNDGACLPHAIYPART